MALFWWRRALNKIAAALRSGPVVAQVPGQVAAAPRTAATEEAQESASFMGEELSENYDEEPTAVVDGEEVAAAALEDEGAGPAAAGLRLRRHRGSGTRAAALEDRRHAVVVSTKCRGRVVARAAVWAAPGTQ